MASSQDQEGIMREFISRLFGFDKEIQALDDMLAYKEARLSELETELTFYKERVFSDYHIIDKIQNVQVNVPSDLRPIKGTIPWNKLRRSLETGSISSIKVKELEQEIDNKVKENAS